MTIDKDQHFKRPVTCQCGWTGLSGELIASGRSPDLLCPQCDEAKIKYIIADAPGALQ